MKTQFRIVYGAWSSLELFSSQEKLTHFLISLKKYARKVILKIRINFLFKNKKVVIVDNLIVYAAKDKRLNANVNPNVDNYNTNKNKRITFYWLLET